MYRADAASEPPSARVPNWPHGSSSGRLLAPTKSWAMWMMVEWREVSPWWYAVCSPTKPASWATFISDASAVSFLAKHAKSTLRCEGLSPSTSEGIERSTSAREKCTSSSFTNLRPGTPGAESCHVCGGSGDPPRLCSGRVGRGLGSRVGVGVRVRRTARTTDAPAPPCPSSSPSWSPSSVQRPAGAPPRQSPRSSRPLARPWPAPPSSTRADRRLCTGRLAPSPSGLALGAGRAGGGRARGRELGTDRLRSLIGSRIGFAPLFLEKAMSIRSASASPPHSSCTRCDGRSPKYSRASAAVDVPSPL